jgi:Ser/Thr protein kinase RdoA (MazF antagonist)
MEKIGAEVLYQIIENFIPGGEVLSIEPLNQGLVNDSFLIKTNLGTYILQRLNSEAFKAPLALMENIVRFQKLPVPKDYSGPSFIKSMAGDYLLKDPTESLWRMQTYIPGTVAYDLAPNLKIAEEAGRLLSGFHLILKDTHTEDYHNSIPGFQDMSLRLDQFEWAFKKADASLIKTAEKALNIIKKLRYFISKLPQEIPIRLCHNDTKLNNMLFNRSTQKGSCLIDLDTLMPGYAFYDFGDTLRCIANTAKEGDTSTAVYFREDYALAFIKGLSQTKGVYTKSEWKSFAFGAVYMPYIHGLRAVTDFLEGNKYYKVKHPNENLERGLCLLQFAAQTQLQQHFLIDSLAQNWKK